MILISMLPILYFVYVVSFNPLVLCLCAASSHHPSDLCLWILSVELVDCSLFALCLYFCCVYSGPHVSVVPLFFG